MADRQFDKSRVSSPWVSVPTFVTGRLDSMDYVFFNWDSTLPANKYRVIVESASNASSNPQDRYRDIGVLTKNCELPGVFFSMGFGSHSKILVLPIDAKLGLPAFIGDLHRGSTYYMNTRGIQTKSGHIMLERAGIV